MAEENLEFEIPMGDDPAPAADKSAAEPDIEIEVVDDREPADRREPAKEGVTYKISADEEATDEVRDHHEFKKRLSKQVFATKEEQRQRIAAVRERDEAIAFAQQMRQQAEQYKAGMLGAHKATVQTGKDKTKSELERAQKEFKEAFETSDSEKLAEVQTRLSRLAAEEREWNRVDVPENVAPEPEFRPTQQAAARPQQSEKMTAWLKDNPWFFKDEKAREYATKAVHPALVANGVVPESEQYFKEIADTMRKSFPEHFKDEAAPVDKKTKPNGPPLGGVNRTPSGAVRIRLTKSEEQVAKRMGVTPAQYAKEKYLLETN